VTCSTDKRNRPLVRNPGNPPPPVPSVHAYPRAGNGNGNGCDMVENGDGVEYGNGEKALAP
jgi:hypothetical protein